LKGKKEIRNAGKVKMRRKIGEGRKKGE